MRARGPGIQFWSVFLIQSVASGSGVPISFGSKTSHWNSEPKFPPQVRLSQGVDIAFIGTMLDFSPQEFLQVPKSKRTLWMYFGSRVIYKSINMILTLIVADAIATPAKKDTALGFHLAYNPVYI